MEFTTTHISNSKGCSDVNKTQDDDNGAKEGPASACPEAASINKMNSPGEELNKTLNSSIRQQKSQALPDRTTTNDHNSGVQQEQVQAGTPLSSPSVDGSQEDVEEKRINHLNKNRQKYIDQIGKANGLRIGTLNIKGKKLPDGKSKYKDLACFIRNNKNTITALTETKLSEEDALKINEELTQTNYDKIIDRYYEDSNNSYKNLIIMRITTNDLLNVDFYTNTDELDEEKELKIFHKDN